MKAGDNLFVYGSLRVGEAADLSQRQGVEKIGADCINGKLYSVGWYPGVKAEPGQFDTNLDVVHGDLFKITDDVIVPLLDAYEGYPNLFNRIETMTANGEQTWVYIYNLSVTEDRRVADGDWCKRVRNATQDLKLNQ